jgi:hypothetical protein
LDAVATLALVGMPAFSLAAMWEKTQPWKAALLGL